MRDPKNAIAYTAQIPAAARESWARGVGQGYARSDPEGAIDWLGQFRGEDWYARTAVTIAMDVAQMNPVAAARLVDGLDAARGTQETQRLTNIIAASWANREPTAAAAWALDNDHPRAHDFASRARVLAGDVVTRSTIDAVQIFGGYGFVNDYPVEKLMRDARAFEALHGDERFGRVLAQKVVA